MNNRILEIQELMAALNRINKTIKLCVFQCCECDIISCDEATYLNVSKWGYERPFCDNCVRNCKICDEDFSPPMAYMHEDCESWAETRKAMNIEDDE